MILRAIASFAPVVGEYCYVVGQRSMVTLAVDLLRLVQGIVSVDIFSRPLDGEDSVTGASTSGINDMFTALVENKCRSVEQGADWDKRGRKLV